MKMKSALTLSIFNGWAKKMIMYLFCNSTCDLWAIKHHMASYATWIVTIDHSCNICVIKCEKNMSWQLKLQDIMVYILLLISILEWTKC
jgi:MinD superfamily P-loop ATPase